MPARLRTKEEEIDLIKLIKAELLQGYKQKHVLNKYGISKMYYHNIKKRNNITF